MLATNPIIAFIPTQDADRARAFYQNILGLRFISDDTFALVFDANGTMLRIVRVGEFHPQPFTILGWEVPDIDAAVAALSAKGVKFSLYPFLRQAPNLVWTAPADASGRSARVAWFLDPDGNNLSLSQH